MKLIDTNIFLEILLDQSKAEIAKKTLTRLIEKEEPIVISSFTIHSIFVILERRRCLNQLKLFFYNLSRIENITFYYPSFEEELEILNRMDTWDLDFDDSFQCYVAQKMNAQIITFDHDFQKIDIISVKIL